MAQRCMVDWVVRLEAGRTCFARRMNRLRGLLASRHATLQFRCGIEAKVAPVKVLVVVKARMKWKLAGAFHHIDRATQMPPTRYCSWTYSFLH